MDVAEARRRVAGAPVARLATIDERGRQHLVPICFAVEGDVLYSAVDSKPKRTTRLQRLDNIRLHPAVTVLVDHYEDDWSRLWWVRLDGPAWVERAGSVLGRVEVLLREKYPQYASVAPFRGEPAALALRWERVQAWAQSGRLDQP